MSDYILSIWFFTIGIHLILFLLIFSGEYVRFPYLLGLEIPLPLVHGPIMYLYILHLTCQNKDKYSGLLHFAPAITVYFILLYFFISPPENKIFVYQNGGGTYKELRKSISILNTISGIAYVSLSLLYVYKYRKEISMQYSNTEKINLSWVYYLIVGIALIWVAVILKNDILIFSLVVVFITVAAYFGITKAGILNFRNDQTDTIIQDDSSLSIEPASVKYQRSNVTEESMQEVYERLTDKMVSEKIFKDPELTLDYTAKLLNIHPNILSQTINTIENKNFYDYINRQRIEEFKRIAVLPENEKFTILSLAFESGFNSKTSFNRNFKKYMHISPREFLQNRNLPLE
ncbi:helix-turn-helix domain-containing protein [Chryseobacterium sp. SSA4.19]|uniref:helix-turn-helix domain-containing protein n=1 Tax=Chryseobacterium sp. SSA4.19 TaxID=2919915 RepID=UPI001F4DC80D|nr:helix-turn-helix domain-containing protein [Chryseobacterium sp. SSA4.19]MCJ8152787.1 helix-turn-helix domain-containing protein [Chryseobacterium sp. SSA4.19]